MTGKPRQKYRMPDGSMVSSKDQGLMWKLVNVGEISEEEFEKEFGEGSNYTSTLATAIIKGEKDGYSRENIVLASARGEKQRHINLRHEKFRPKLVNKKDKDIKGSFQAAQAGVGSMMDNINERAKKAKENFDKEIVNIVYEECLAYSKLLTRIEEQHNA
jgi:hypothetical protein